MIALPIIILVGLLGGLVFGTVRNSHELATQAYEQQHRQEQPASADAPRPEPRQ